jgi:hypothetical protein
MSEMHVLAGLLALFGTIGPRMRARLRRSPTGLDRPFGRRDGRFRWRHRVPATIVMFPPETEVDETITTIDPVADAA